MARRRRSGRRSSTSLTDFFSDVVDEVKDFVDDDVLDRTRDAERDLRRAGRNWTDSDDDRGRRTRVPRDRVLRDGGPRDRDRSSPDEDIDDLRRAIKALGDKINSLSGPDMPISGYDGMTAVDISNRLTSLSQSELEKVHAYERRHANRSTVLGRIDTLRGSEPWKGYDDQTVTEIRNALTGADEVKRSEVRSYETGHKKRQGVLDAT